MKSRMNREVHVRFCERFRGEIPLYLLDLFRSAWFSALAKLYSFAIFGLCVGCCELQMCMALALAIVSIFQLKLITDKS